MPAPPPTHTLSQFTCVNRKSVRARDAGTRRMRYGMRTHFSPPPLHLAANKEGEKGVSAYTRGHIVVVGGRQSTCKIQRSAGTLWCHTRARTHSRKSACACARAAMSGGQCICTRGARCMCTHTVRGYTYTHADVVCRARETHRWKAPERPWKETSTADAHTLESDVRVRALPCKSNGHRGYSLFYTDSV